MDKFYTPEEINIIEKYYGRIPVREIQRMYLPDRTEGSIRGKAVRLGLRSNITTSKIRYDPELPDASDMDFDELWEAAYAFQRASQALSTRYDEVNVYLDVDRPIGIPFIADVHIGAVSTPLDLVRERFYLIQENSWLYPFGAGDKVDNFLPTKHPQGMFGVMFPPELQKELVENLYSKAKGRWIALVQGCHDDFSHQTDDFDFTKYMAKRMNCANLGFGGAVNLHVGEQMYRIVVRHKYRYNSSLNNTHTCKRLQQMEYPNADILCVGHHHVADIEQIQHRDKDRIYIRPGSMKGPDRFARSLGYSATGSCTPTVMLWPDKRKMMPFMHLEDVIDLYSKV